jgi:hypothetical protein
VSAPSNKIPAEAPRPNQKRERAIAIFVIPAVFILIFVAKMTYWIAVHPAPPDIATLRARLVDLTSRQQAARAANSGADTSDLDRQIKDLQGELAILENEAEAGRRQDELRKLREEEVALKRRCEALREKRISDLTVNDVEILKKCGVAVPPLPAP